MIINKILFLDVETGGLDPFNHSLLEIGLVLWEDGEIKDTLNIKLRHNIYKITRSSLEFNGINLIKHDNESIPCKEAYNKIISFVNNHYNNGEKITLGGHNIGKFDFIFLKEFIEKYDNNLINNRFSHRFVDTSSILKFLYHSNIINKKVFSLNKALKHFNLTISDGERHTGIGDAKIEAELYTKLINLIKNKVK